VCQGYGRIILVLMNDLVDAAPSRRRRADARRSVQAIVDAARRVLAERADASMEEIAAAAGVSRQTVYAHFPSRHTLVGAVVDAAGGEVLAAIQAARLEARVPTEALIGFLDIGWQLLRRYYPLLLDSPAAHTALVRDDPHHVVTTLLEQIIRRGQHTGDFDRALPVTWLAAAILGLGHTAAEQVATGQLGSRKAAATLRQSALRLCGATGPHP
jgi:AcrR family transcriptional regulator